MLDVSFRFSINRHVRVHLSVQLLCSPGHDADMRIMHLQLYTQEFYQDILKPRLSSGGIFVTQSGPAGVLTSQEVCSRLPSPVLPPLLTTVIW